MVGIYEGIYDTVCLVQHDDSWYLIIHRRVEV